MINTSQFQQLSLNKLFKRLDAKTTVVTPNQRLAQALKERFDQYQLNRKKLVWHSADILPFSSFIERIYLDALYSGRSFEIPLLLSSSQVRVLWEEVLLASETGNGLLNLAQTVQLANEAWQLLHAWRLSSDLGNYFLNEDSRAFQEWTESYAGLLTRNHQIDHIGLTDLIITLLGQSITCKAENLICYGFDILTPQQKDLLNKLSATGCTVMLVQPLLVDRKQSTDAGVKRLCCVDNQEEIYQAAVWARSRLEANQDAFIGIVVPALADCHKTVIRIFGEVMRPDVQDALPQEQEPNMPFNVSLGEPLSAYPLVETAFLILDLIEQGLTYDSAGYLLRSPFLGGAEIEMNQRALLELRVRRYAEPLITLEQLVMIIRLVNGGDDEGNHVNCPVLVKNLSMLLTFCQHNFSFRRQHATFAQMFSQALQIMGFPGERGLSSTEYQTLKKWHAVVADFATLDCVKTQTSYKNAVRQLKILAANTLFQPQTPAVPIQILGVFEAAGMMFDHLWVMGLSDEQWPLRPRPNPFLPYELQKKAQIPMNSTLEALGFSERLKDGWLSSAREIVLSHAKFSDSSDGREILPSYMIRSIPEYAFDVPFYRRHRDLIIETALLEKILDDQVPPLGNHEISGGVAVIKDYAACPFRAWARYCIGIKSKDVPHFGLDARERGNLMHQTLALLWDQLETKEALDNLSQYDIEKIVAVAVDEAISGIKRQRPFALSNRFAAIERRRLLRLTHEWLGMERKRKSFHVIAKEEKRTIRIGEMILQARLDRIDELANGQLIIIDYKTRKYPIEAMLGERPDEPQLPLYLVMSESAAASASSSVFKMAGVAFATIKPGQMGFSAIVCEQDLLPGVKVFNQYKACAQFETWDELITKWQQSFNQLGKNLMRGDVKVLPKNYPVTCQYCDVRPFCRIHERLKSVSVDPGTGDD